MTRSTTTKLLRPLIALLACAAIFPFASEAAGGGSSEKPVAITGAIARVRGNSAELEGTVVSGTQTSSYYFQYGPTSAYGSQTTPGTLPPGTTRVKVGQTVLGFIAGYHYRLVATSSKGTSDGHDRTYTTKKLKSALTVVKPAAPAVFARAFTIAGTLGGPGNANRVLMLQSSPYPFLTPFVTSGTPVLTNAAGAFLFHVPGLAASTQFRVATVAPRPTYSPLVTEQVAPKVTLKVRTSPRKGLVRLYGTVTPAEVGASVSFQLGKAVRPKGKSEVSIKYSTQASTVAKKATSTVSRFSMVVEVRNSGHYRAFVQVKKGPLVSGSSPTVTLVAGPVKKKH